MLAFYLEIQSEEFTMWLTPQLAHWALTWGQIFPLLFVEPITPHWCSLTLCALEQITNFAGLFPQSLIRLWPILQQVMYTELGPASQYFSTILMRRPKRRPDMCNFSILVSPLTVIIMAKSGLFPVICASLSWSLLIDQRGSVFLVVYPWITRIPVSIALFSLHLDTS